MINPNTVFEIKQSMSLYFIVQHLHRPTQYDTVKTKMSFSARLKILTNNVYYDTVCRKYTKTHCIPLELVPQIQVHNSHLTCKCLV